MRKNVANEQQTNVAAFLRFLPNPGGAHLHPRLPHAIRAQAHWTKADLRLAALARTLCRAAVEDVLGKQVRSYK